MNIVKVKVEYEIDIDLDSIVDDLAKFEGLPPYNDGANHCVGDGYFANSLEQKYGNIPISQLIKIRNEHIGKPEVQVNYIK